jgi:hypothetical protein
LTFSHAFIDPFFVIVYYKGERMGEARPLGLIANDRKLQN